MNFYPQWSTKQLYVDKRGRIAFQETEHDGEGFAELITDYYERYRVPIMITETSAVGSDEVREKWLESSVGMIKNLRTGGVPVIGYTWFPFFTMIDWRYRFATEPLEDFYLELGLFKLNRESDHPRWLSTPIVEKMKGYVENSAVSVGDLNLAMMTTA
jgi:beta-glucosidase